MITNNTLRDGAHVSPWQENLPGPLPNAGKTVTSQVYDCLIVGGGITGLTAALLLQKEGKQTIIAEAHTIGFGTTGGTSAHINTFADTTYPQAESAFGEQSARLFADAINEGIAVIKSNVESLNIDCDYEEKTGFIYAENETQAKQLKEMYESTLKVGVAVEYAEPNVPTPVPFIQALQFPGQAQYHPLKYLQGLQNAYLEAGGIIREHTLIKNVNSENGVHTAEAGDISIKTLNVIYATHMPPNINVFNFECAPYRSYVIAAKLPGDEYPDALIYDMQEPYHYIRTHRINSEPLLLVGGLDHKTGHEDPQRAFAQLEEYTRKYYDVVSVDYKWSSQYYVPVDGLPYIGQLPLAADGIYCATGYNGNGMMLGSIAGKILSDLVKGTGSKYQEVFSPSRVKPVDGFTEFVKENADVAYRFIADRIAVKGTESLKNITPGTGKVVEVDGKKVAAYRDENGSIHTISPVCTHTSCIVNWNSEEKSWDCPCHGARYNIDGEVLTGPATHDLKKIEIDES